jgi:hypothetical protein
VTPAQIRALSAKGYTTDQIAEIAECIAVEEIEIAARKREDTRQRVRAHRERKHEQNQQSCNNVTRYSVTPTEIPSKINGHVTEPKTGTPNAQESLLLTTSESKKDSIGAHRIAVDWKPTETDRAWSVKYGMSLTEIQDQADRFFDYWKAIGGQRARKTDWAGTWRNWCRKFLDDNPRQSSFIPPTRQAEYDAENERNKVYWLKVLAEEKNNGQAQRTRA